jgi:hypothetical protein
MDFLLGFRPDPSLRLMKDRSIPASHHGHKNSDAARAEHPATLLMLTGYFRLSAPIKGNSAKTKANP